MIIYIISIIIIIIALLFIWLIYEESPSTRRFTEKVSLSDKIILITGANAGTYLFFIKHAYLLALMQDHVIHLTSLKVLLVKILDFKNFLRNL